MEGERVYRLCIEMITLMLAIASRRVSSDEVWLLLEHLHAKGRRVMLHFVTWSVDAVTWASRRSYVVPSLVSS